MEVNEFKISGLFMYHTPIGPNPNQSATIEAHATTGLGSTVVHNWTVFDGPGPNATLVARAQGEHVYAGNWQNSFSILFENENYKGSTIQVMGISVEQGEWAIVGGTGKFAMATGVIYKKFHEQRSHGNIIEITLHGFCPLLKASTSVVKKLGPWGGNGGDEKDVKVNETPKRLVSITVRGGAAIDSIAYSYIDQADQPRNAGPWGGQGGNIYKVDLGPNEFVKQVSGTIGNFNGANVITSLKFETNVKTHGPFGTESGAPLDIPPSKGKVVGFHIKGGVFLDAIGIYEEQ